MLWDYLFACRHRVSGGAASDLQGSIEVVAIAMVPPHHPQQAPSPETSRSAHTRACLPPSLSVCMDGRMALRVR